MPPAGIFITGRGSLAPKNGVLGHWTPVTCCAHCSIRAQGETSCRPRRCRCEKDAAPAGWPKPGGLGRKRLGLKLKGCGLGRKHAAKGESMRFRAIACGSGRRYAALNQGTKACGFERKHAAWDEGTQLSTRARKQVAWSKNMRLGTKARGFGPRPEGTQLWKHVA